MSQNYFTDDVAQAYDERNAHLAPISACLHFMLELVLQGLPNDARILSVGAGTGAEILALAPVFPKWTFVAVDPSAAMLDVCRERVREAGFEQRCEFVHGYVEDVGTEPPFDAILSLFVAHFVERAARAAYLREMASRLRSGGMLVSAEISFDLNSEQFPSMLENWRRVQALSGATEEALKKLPTQLRDMLHVVSPDETEALMRSNGFRDPLRFFQAFMITGWHATKA